MSFSLTHGDSRRTSAGLWLVQIITWWSRDDHVTTNAEADNYLPTGQTTVNKKAPIHYIYNPYKWHGPHTPLKMFQKIPPKFHNKAVQSNILWLNLNKIGGISILRSAKKKNQGNTSFHFPSPGSKRRYPCSQTASAVLKYFPCLLQFCTGYCFWHASRVWKRKTSKKRWFTHSWKYPDTTNIVFAIL